MHPMFYMKRLVTGLVVLAAGVAATAFAAEDKENLSEARINEIIQTFARKESEFSKIREIYTWRQTSRLLEFAPEGPAGGKWEMVWDVVFVNGKRAENVVRAPVSTLNMIVMEPNDEQDLRSTLPFVLTSEDLPNYAVYYLGHETIDEIGCYVFAVKPKKVEAKKRYFVGEVYVDDRDLQIVKSFGRGSGLRTKGRYPRFETYREQIDGKYWFPTYTVANDVLQFDEGNQVRVKLTSRYENYKRFQAESTIRFGDEATDAAGGAGAAPSKPDLAPPLAPGKAPVKKK